MMVNKVASLLKVNSLFYFSLKMLLSWKVATLES